jgi:putative oxidoreductase
MIKFLNNLFEQASPETVQLALAIMRISIGILTIGHGFPKMMGGVQEWRMLGTTFMNPLGIYFLPVMWGFLGAVTEFIGGIALTLGFGTRIACFALIIMMIIATAWHIQKGDSFNQWSFPLSLAFVYLGFLIIGSDKYSIEYLLFNK